MKRNEKRPTRRKPDRRSKQHSYYSIVERYESPWWVTLYGLLIVIAIVGIPAVLSATHLMGWW